MDIVKFNEGHKQRLSELFDTPMPPFEVYEQRNNTVYSMEIDGRPYLVKFVRERNQADDNFLQYFFRTTDLQRIQRNISVDDDNQFYHVHVLFGPTNNADSGMISSYDMTNRGHAATTISIVAGAIKHFLRHNHDFSVITYLADLEDEGRVRAYTTLTKKLAREYNGEHHIVLNGGGPFARYFVFVKDLEHEWRFAEPETTMEESTKLQELGDKAYPLSIENDSDPYLEFTSDINGKLYDFHFVRFQDDTEYVLGTFAKGQQVAIQKMMELYNIPEYSTVYDSFFHLVDDDHNYSAEITGTGDAAFVFATAQSAYKKFFEQTREGFDILHFSAKEPSRVRLYDFFAVMLRKQKGWKVETITTSEKHYFVLNTKHFGATDAEEELKWRVD